MITEESFVPLLQVTHDKYKTKTTEFKVEAGVVTRLDMVLQQADLSTLGREDLSTKSTHSAASTIQQFTLHLVWSFVPLAFLSLNGLI